MIALLDIYRVYFNYFEDRPYASAQSDRQDNAPVTRGTAKARVPGTDIVVDLEKRRSSAPVKRTPAMRLGVQQEKHNPKTGQLIMPSLHRILYRPWTFYGTPLWEKFENPKADLRRKRSDKEKQAATGVPHNDEDAASRRQTGLSFFKAESGTLRGSPR